MRHTSHTASRSSSHRAVHARLASKARQADARRAADTQTEFEINREIERGHERECPFQVGDVVMYPWFDGRPVEVKITGLHLHEDANPQFDGYRTDYPEMTIWGNCSRILH